MKKVVLSLVVVLIFSMGVVVLADSFDTPGEVFADLKGITLEEAYNLRGSDKTFGELAKGEEFYEEFLKANLESKKAIIEQKVNEGLITTEQAQELLTLLESCDGTGQKQLGKKYGIGFGKEFNNDGNCSGNGRNLTNGKGKSQRRGRGNGLGRNNSN